MIIFKIVAADNGTEIGFATTTSVAIDSVRISYSAWADAKFTESIEGVTVHRKGFPPLRFIILPVELHTHATHL